MHFAGSSIYITTTTMHPQHADVKSKVWITNAIQNGDDTEENVPIREKSNLIKK